MTLYEINDQLRTLIENQFDETCIDAETGEIDDSLLCSQISGLILDIDSKMDNIACYIKNLTADSSALKAEEATLSKRRKSKDAKADRLKSYLSDFMKITNNERFESARCALSFIKSKIVFIDDESLVRADESFLKYAEPTIDKMAIKERLKNGEYVPGAYMKQNLTLKIK